MTIDKINQTLRERFAQPLPDYYNRRIIFWHDSEREFESMLDELELPDVKLLKLTGTNTFSAKMLLSETDTDSNYLVYNPISYKKIQDDWLRDIEHYSEEFRADLVSMQMDELNIPQTVPLRRAMKLYTKFFENKERTARLAALGTTYENAVQLHVDIMAVLSGAKPNTVQGIIRTILCGGMYMEENQPLANILKFGREDVLREMLGKYTGYADENLSLFHLAAHILLTALSGSMDQAILSGLEQHITEENQAFCYAILDEWMHSDEDEKLFEIAQEVEQQYDIFHRLEKLDMAKLLATDCLPCVDECIISRFMNEISEGVIKSTEIIHAVEQRRTVKWYKKFAYFYDGLFEIANMQAFYLEHVSGFHYGEYAQMWSAYCEELYLMDTYYRRFHVAFRKSLKNASSDLDDLFKNVADTAERLYKNWYLTELGQQWCMLIRSDMEEMGRLCALPQQERFYRDKVKPILQSGSRVYVIISDAFRFEVAAELTEKLIRETNGTAKLSAMQSVFPSATKYGMAALLPHENLQLTDSFDVLCDGESAKGTESRDRILKKYCPKNVAVSYQDLLSMKQVARRELVSGAETVYIYHNTIDAVGDKLATEDQVFEACKSAVEELKNLVKLIVNSMSGSNILITADHGFLYSYQPLSESDKAEKSLVSGEILELDRRSMIAEDGSTSDILMRIPLENYHTDLCGYAPMENIRMKKQGGGMNYVHGGIALQECAVPVIEFKNIRAGSKHFVDIKKVEIQILSQTRKISNNIFSLDFYQRKAVGGKTVPATYELYICDSMGKVLSDVQTIIADKTNEEPQDRVTRVRFTMKGQEYPREEQYFLNIVEKGTTNVLAHIEFTINIAFVNDFDF